MVQNQSAQKNAKQPCITGTKDTGRLNHISFSQTTLEHTKSNMPLKHQKIHLQKLGKRDQKKQVKKFGGFVLLL